MQRGVPIWEAAGFLGMSPEVLQDTYGHHHPDHLHGAAAAIGQKGRYVSVAETVANLTMDRNQKKKPSEFWSEWQESNVTPFCLIFQHVVVTPSCNRGRFQGC
jgi:hypothetical protein